MRHLALACSLCLAACAPEPMDADALEAELRHAADHGAMAYITELRPLNAHAGGAATGFAGFDLDKNFFTGGIWARGLAPDQVHPMHVHATAECPTAAHDANGDGYVDVIEGVPAYGLILVPIDSNLASQGKGELLSADADGKLAFQQSVRAADLLADLTAKDPDPDDPVIKLGEDEALALETRTVVVHGVAPDTELPDTVASLGSAPAQLTLPVACGEIRSFPAASRR